MKQENHVKDVKNNGKGAVYDTDKEISGIQNDSTYLDSKNGRVSSDRGNKRSWEKIRGEEMLYQNDISFYSCIGSIGVNNHLVEFWASNFGGQTTNPPRIVVDGVIRGSSDKMPWNQRNPLQMDKNESCVGGEVYITDNNTVPMILNIEDLISPEDGPETYFEDYNPALYSVNLDAPVDIPVFKELQFVGGGGGLPVGSYQYSLRYVNSEGDRTNWGPLTNHIPVLQKYSEGGTIYPYQSSYGDVSNLELPSPYGIKLKFRVTNIADYDFVEVRRISYNNSEGIGVVPEGEIVARIDIGDQEVSVRTFVDPLNSNVNETLTEEDESYQNTVIKRAKSVRYHDKRLVLMNVETETQTPDATFIENDGDKIFPVVEKLGKAGHKDPYNHHNYKNYMSGEKNSFGVSFYDSSGGKSFVLNHPDLVDVQAPNRRDGMSSKSLKYSYGGASIAANVSGSVGNTFEVFDLENAVSKTDLCSFKNITNRKSKLGKEDPTVQNKEGAGYTGPSLTKYCEEDHPYGSVAQAHEVGYRPYTPTGKNSNDDGHNYIINPQVDTDGNDGLVDYRPKAFGPNYYSKGYALSGISNIPDWAKSFSVVQTEEAERVVCQGLGMYSMSEADITGAFDSKKVDKSGNRMWFYSPDIEAGLVSSGILTDLNDNPQNYEVQFVSPLGFFSEVFDFEEITSLNNRDRCIDMITYARILHDEGQINPTENTDMGIGFNGDRHVAYNRYRNDDSSTQGFFSGNGNKTNTLAGFDTITEGRNVYYDLELSQNIYQHSTIGGSSESEYDKQGMKNWTEPFYIVNIIQKGRSLVDNDVDFYRNTGTYQKVDSVIGQSDGSLNQEFELVDERWEDCIPALSSSHQMSGDNVFVYIQQKDLSKKAWLNVTYKSATDISSIETAISSNGYYIDPSTNTFVYGTYTHSISSNKRDFTLKLNQGYAPEEDLKIIVSYDNRRPIRIFGGNTTVGDTVFAPIDRVSDGSKNADEDDATFDETAEIEFEFSNICFPFREYHQNPRHYSIVRTTGGNRIQDSNKCRLTWIRQLAVLFTCESRTATHYAHISQYPLQYFPAVNYVQRPRRWDTDDFGSQSGEIISKENNLWYQYFRDFPEEWNNWQYGGFRINQQSNIDYSKQGPLEFTSAPDFGFEEKNEYCTGIFWSLPRPINAQDAPGLKTFTDLNKFEIDDDQGEIKFAYDAKMGEKGSNLYAITETGVCLLLTNKSVLSNPNSTELTVTAQDTFIGDEYWVSKDIGSNDQMWRGIAEDSVEVPTESGRMLVDALYMPNDYSVFRLMGNEIKDIAKDTYFTRINPILQEINPGFETKITGGFDRNHNEYWLSVERPSGDKEVFVYAQDTSHFVGFFTYNFDQYTFIGSEMYGSRESETYLLNKGYQINGENIESYLIQKTSPNQPIEKEFIDFEVLTGPRGTMKPTRVEFLDEDQNFLSALDESVQGPLYLKQYDGWRQFIPRKDESVDPKQSRIQYRLLLYKIFHNLAEDFKIVDSIIQYKEIK